MKSNHELKMICVVSWMEKKLPAWVQNPTFSDEDNLLEYECLLIVYIFSHFLFFRMP